jgi:ATP-dependent Clp protease adaptor protein ClpS
MSTADIEVIEKIDETIKVQIPKMYKVLLHNDDTTTFDFVILVLVQIFHRTVEDAIEITKAIHVNQQGIAGSPYTREIAEEKTIETISFSRANNFPLTATFEEV